MTYFAVDPPPASGLNAADTFERIPSTNMNRLPHAASLTVAHELGDIYNPLYLWGDLAIAAQLLHAIGNRVIQRRSGTPVKYMTGATMRTMIETESPTAPTAFSTRYRYLDLLLIADIQPLIEPDAPQALIAQNLRLLYTRSTQIVVSARQLPRHFPKGDTGLRAFLESGLVAQVHPVT